LRSFRSRYSLTRLSYIYRQSWSYDEKELEQAGQLAQKLKAAVTAPGGSEMPLNSDPAYVTFTSALDNDLDTFAAISALTTLAEEILTASRAGRRVDIAQDTLRCMAGIFGLRLNAENSEPRVKTGWAEHLKRFRQK
jgi:cysteinyl-tRNA synthetase